MAVTGASVTAAAAATSITLVLCFYLFLRAKRYRGAAAGGGGRARFVVAGDGVAEPAIAALPRRKEVAPGDPAAECAVCITELAPGEDARVLPRCGHGFHADCVGAWLRSHSTCPLCRRAVVGEERAVRPPEADPECPAFPTNVLFFGSQDAVVSTLSREPPAGAGPIAGVAAVVEAARVAALRRLLGCRGATPSSPSPSPPQQEGRDLESGLGGGESSGSPPAKPQSGC